MKKILLINLLFVSTLLTVKTYGQFCEGGTGACNLIPQDVRITVLSQVCDDPLYPGKTVVVFDINFKLLANNGNKQIYFHTWLENEVPASLGTSIFPCGGSTENNVYSASVLGAAANYGQTGFSILDIGLLNQASAAPGVVQVMVPRATSGPGGYTHDQTVILTSPLGPNPTAPGMTVTKVLLSTGGLDSISMKNVKVVIPGTLCGTTIKTKTLVWANQTNNGDNAQCWAANVGQTLNDPTIALQTNCNIPRQYAFSITTANTTETVFDYKVILSDPLNVAADIEILSGTTTRSVGGPNGPTFTFPFTNIQEPYGSTNPYGNWNIRVDVTSPSFLNTVTTGEIGLGCGATLPIKLRSFNADRNKSNVDLKWVTEIEDNNRGFYVERMLSNGGWQAITFVASQAPNGNSNSPLTYVLTDFNNTKGISQYRLRQVDIDGKQAYSQIRSVRGEGQKSNTIIYPNPSGDGKVNIVFEGAVSMRDVSLMDVSGKTLKQWKGVTNNNIRIDNLNAGFYTVRIVNLETGEQVVEKFIVNKR